MSTTPILLDDSIPLLDLVRGLASVGLTVAGDRRGGLVVTTPEKAEKLRGRDLRAACTDNNTPPRDAVTDGAGSAHSIRHELREDDDRQRAADINDQRRVLGL